MKVEDLKINGIKNPMGFSYDKIKCSWKVRDTKAKTAKNIKIDVSLDSGFNNIIYSKEGKDLNSSCEILEVTCTPHTRYFYRVYVEGENGETALSKIAFFETGKMSEKWVGKWIKTEDRDKFHPVFFRKFKLNKKVKTARLYICGLGLYEAYLNNKKIGDELLAPLYSDYRVEYQYQTYDITDMLEEKNNIDIWMGNGWYKGRFGLGGFRENFGDKFMAIAEIYIEFQDGEIQVISTDHMWKYRGSDIELSDIYDGEIYNKLMYDQKENVVKNVQIVNEVKQKLIERYSLPVKEKEIVQVKEIIKTPKNEIVLDFGQNFAGYVKFLCNQPKGTKITLDFGEILQKGNFYNDNYRSAKSQFVYISNGEKELVRPHFTYFGFRFVRVSGWIGEIHKEDFMGSVIYSDMDTTGEIESGNKKLNGLISNCMWGQKSNFLDFPTDCPQRDERLAWTGDAQIFSRTACYNMDTRAFYNKFIHELRIEQERLDGIVPGVIPVFDPKYAVVCSVWGDIATILPTVLYEYYGDKEGLNKHYSMMKDWVDYINREDEKRGKRYLFDFGNHIGDWLALDGKTEQSMKGGTDDYFIASCYYANSVKNVASAAKVLGKFEDKRYYPNLYENIIKAIFKEYFSESGRMCVDTQTAYLIALNLGIYKDKEKIKEALKTRLYKDCYKLKCGFVGAPMMCKVLAENGFEEEALYFLLQEEYPGWMHCINLGATTIWERWNSVLDDGTVSGIVMNSLNHYSFGAVLEYIYRNILGIQSAGIGFKRVRFVPQIDNKIGYMKGSYDSVSGKYSLEWRICEDGMIEINVEVPFNCSGIIKLPLCHSDEIELEPGKHNFRYKPLKDLKQLFTEKTLFRDMIKNEEAVKIIKEISPNLYSFLENKDEDFLSESLSTLENLGFLGFSREQIDELISKIAEIKR